MNTTRASAQDDSVRALHTRPESDATEGVTFDPDAMPDERLDWRVASLVAVAACLSLGALETMNDVFFRRLGGESRSWFLALRAQMPWWTVWMLFMPPVLWLARTHRFEGDRWRRSAVVHVGMGLIVSLAHCIAFSVLHYYGISSTTPAATLLGQANYVLARFLFFDFMTYCAAISVYYSFEYFSNFRRSALAAAHSEARAARLQLNLSEARIHALRMELNPHFLFNALNSVSGLVRKREHDAAIEMLARLGELLRTTLDRDMPPEVPLSEEVELLRRFLDIELVRFGDRLRVSWDIEPDAYDALVPPLILQPLVENALRHGISRRPGAALLRVSAQRIGLHLELAVRDTGEGLSAVDGRPTRKGIGLANTRSRLEELYGPEATSVELADVPGGGARARLLLPFHLTRGRGDVAVGA